VLACAINELLDLPALTRRSLSRLVAQLTEREMYTERPEP
jgi:hypothetical protein